MNCALLSWAASQDKLKPHELGILIRLVGLMDDDGRLVMAQADLWRHMGIGERQTRAAVSALVSGGYLKRTRRGTIGKGRTPDLLSANFRPSVDKGEKPPPVPLSAKKQRSADVGDASPPPSAKSDSADNAVKLPVSAIQDAEFVDNTAAPIGTGARAQKLTLNTTLSELNPEPVELASTAVAAREAPPLKLNGSAKAMPAHQLLANLIRIVDHWALQHTKGIHNTCALIPQWMADGADFDIDIVPTVAALCARKTGQPASTLRYFDAAVREAARTRIIIERQPPNPITASEARNDFAPSAPGNLQVRGGKISPGSANYLRNREAARLADEQRRLESGAGK